MNWQLFFPMIGPWLAVAAACALILLLAALPSVRKTLLLPIVALAGVGVAFGWCWKLWVNGVTFTGGMLVFDRLSFLGWMAILVAALFTLFLSVGYLRSRSEMHPEYFALLLLSLLGMACLIAGADLVTIFLGIETMSVAVYVLAGFLRHRPEGNEAALKYFLIGAFASAFLLMGIAFAFGAAGTTDLAVLSMRASEILASEGRTYFLFSIAMLVIGFGFKVAAVPFHAWAPDVYDGAPTPMTAFMATAVKVAAFVALLRVAQSLIAPVGEIWQHVAWGLAVATMTVGNLAAIVQKNIKRMLAYSSIAHAGYLLVAFPFLGIDGTSAVRSTLFYLVAYTMMTIGAFAVVVAVQGADESAELNRFTALSRRNPVLAAVFALFLVALAGFPPTIGFFAKYYLFLGAVKAGFVWLVIVALINSAISAYYYLRPIVVMYFHESNESELPHVVTALPVIAVIVITALAVLFFGLFPSDLLAIVEHSAF